ncbi:MAG: acyl-CoA/acyl-ACP dehydrogenase [Thermoleophilia bacterium]|nr:acyl-CoA/acyl-ACP dehydrogenase [Thermoleophilia bacterium]
MQEEYRLIQDSAKRLAEALAAEAGPGGIAADAFSRQAVEALVASGLWALASPPEYAGVGGDPRALALVAYELARVSGSLALSFVAHSSVCRALDNFGSSAQKQDYLPRLAAGSVGAFAVHEAASGAVAAAVATRAELAGLDLLLTGSKFFVTNGREADVILALARSDSQEADGPSFSVILLDGSTPGLTRGPHDSRMGLNGTGSCEMVFRRCRVPAEQVVGDVGGGMGVLKAALVEYAFFGAAAVSLGLANSCLDIALRHASERTIQGLAIGEQQAVRLMIAEMDGLVGASGMLLWDAATRAVETPEQAVLLASRAKRFTSSSAVRVADLAIQVCAGHGYSRELPLENHYRDARGLTIHYKTTELLGFDIAGLVLERRGAEAWPPPELGSE